MIDPYSIACVQTDIRPFYVDESMTPHPENLEKNLRRACELGAVARRWGVSVVLSAPAIAKTSDV